MKRPLLFGLTALLSVAGLLVAGCGGSQEASGSDSSAAPGVTDNQIVLGTHLPLSGSPAAAYGVIADGMSAYFDYVNSQGGVYGRKIKLIIGDDHYSPPDAMEVVRNEVEQQHVLAIVGGVGDQTELAVMNYLEDQGVPDMFVGGGLPIFTDPLVRTRFTMETDYVTETKIMGDFVDKNLTGKREGILYEDDEAGLTGVSAVEDLLKEKNSDIRIISKQAYDPTAADVTAQMERLKADNPDFVVLMANVAAAANAIKVSREVLNWNVPFVISAVSAVEATIALAGPANIEGTISMTTGKMISETNDAGVQRHIELMKEFEPSVQPSGLTEYGMAVAELTVQALKNAGPNLTRDSLITGAENIRNYCGLLGLGPVNLSPTDHRVSEGGWPEKVIDGKWVRVGEPSNYESTPGDVYACTGEGQPIYKATSTPSSP
ncbi:MAG: ABC transporter substrate-binding protein [Dehalococcoidia bacterium]|jgi:ABC-type branched-subunit amino acid transport system substrate-binding protein